MSSLFETNNYVDELRSQRELLDAIQTANAEALVASGIAGVVHEQSSQGRRGNNLLQGIAPSTLVVTRIPARTNGHPEGVDVRLTIPTGQYTDTFMNFPIAYKDAEGKLAPEASFTLPQAVVAESQVSGLEALHDEGILPNLDRSGADIIDPLRLPVIMLPEGAITDRPE